MPPRSKPSPKQKARPRQKARPAASRKARAAQIRARLAAAIPEPRCELDHRSPWELLVATILSAQSTDRTVNRVTPEVFRRWPDPAALAAADRAEIEAVVKSTGFFRNKARAIQEAARVIAAEHGGQVPREMDAMLALPGVARKTANVVLGTAYGIASGIVVDTHVSRVAARLGLTRETDPVKIEADLCALFQERTWIDTGHRLLLHGRYVCLARAPLCERCPLNEPCPSREAAPAGAVKARAQRERELVEARGEPTR